MIRDATAADIPALAALNDAEAQHVNALGEAGLRAARVDYLGGTPRAAGSDATGSRE